MEWEIKLIYIYCTVCHFFSQTPAHKKIRKSPNQVLEFTDEEVITIFISGLIEGHKNLKNIHQFIYAHLKKWFPKLPNYSAFHHRLDELAYEIVAFSDYFGRQFSTDERSKTILIDSMPIIIAKGSRSGFSKIAKGLANLGYCASKKKKILTEDEANYSKIVNSIRQPIESFF